MNAIKFEAAQSIVNEMKEGIPGAIRESCNPLETWASLPAVTHFTVAKSDPAKGE